jgi:hypothetical protein
VLNEGRLDELSARPQVGGEEGVGLLEGLEDGAAEVLLGLGLTSAAGVNVVDTSELEDLLGHGGSNATSSTRSRDESHIARAALSSHLHGDGVDASDTRAPVATTHGHDVQLGINEGALDGDLDFLGDLDADADMTGAVSNGNDDLESGSLTGLGLLLDGEDAHDLVRELSLGVGKESVNDGSLLDGNGVGINLLELGDAASLHQTAELGHGSPLVLAAHSSASGATSTATSATTGTESSGGSFAALSRGLSRSLSRSSFHVEC